MREFQFLTPMCDAISMQFDAILSNPAPVEAEMWRVMQPKVICQICRFWSGGRWLAVATVMVMVVGGGSLMSEDVLALMMMDVDGW